jgi:hypothetical protein
MASQLLLSIAAPSALVAFVAVWNYPNSTPSWAMKGTWSAFWVLLSTSIASGLDLLGYHWFLGEPLFVYVGAAVGIALLVWLAPNGTPAPVSCGIEAPLKEEGTGAVASAHGAQKAFDPPHNVDARSALFFAANGTWTLRPNDREITSEAARELQRVYDALRRFYESASHEGGLRVWGRTSMSRPFKLIERTHWQDWHIEPAAIFGSEPLRTVPRDRLPSGSSPYFDLHLSKAEVESVWQPASVR